jgi:hypothetical protein
MNFVVGFAQREEYQKKGKDPLGVEVLFADPITAVTYLN